MEGVLQLDHFIDERKRAIFQNTSKGLPLQKGIVDDLTGSYNSNQIKFATKGSEIKEALNSLEDKIEDAIQLNKKSLNDMIVAIGSTPNRVSGYMSADDYNSKGIQPLFVYDDDKCYTADENGRYTQNDQNKLCDKYNSLVYQTLRAMEDLSSVRIMIARFDEKKSYDLTLQQLKSLGIKE